MTARLTIVLGPDVPKALRGSNWRGSAYCVAPETYLRLALDAAERLAGAS